MVDVLYVHNASMISGGERSLLQLWAALDRALFTPHVLLPQDGVFAQEIRRSGVDVAFWRAPALRPWTTPDILRARRGLMEIVRLKNIRLIHSYAPRNNLLSSWVGRDAGVAVVWHERNLLWQGEGDVSRMCLGWPDGIICNSRAVAARFQVKGMIPDKVRVILNGVDADYFMPSVCKAEDKARLGWGTRKVLGVVTNLEPRKGVEVFLDIAAAMARQCPDVLFVVVGGCYGSGDRRVAALKQRALELGLEDNLVWMGFQSDVRPFVRAFDIHVHVTMQEACSRAILESMSMRVPVVAFDDGGNPELIVDGETGYLVPSGRADLMVQRLVSLVDRDVELLKTGQAARQRVQAVFNAQRNAIQTQAFYQELGRRVL
ncbi:MAG: glycosyltransferase family 4 protein [Candidatus Omnitrophota bacterium]